MVVQDESTAPIASKKCSNACVLDHAGTHCCNAGEAAVAKAKAGSHWKRPEAQANSRVYSGYVAGMTLQAEVAEE